MEKIEQVKQHIESFPTVETQKDSILSRAFQLERCTFCTGNTNSNMGRHV